MIFFPSLLFQFSGLYSTRSYPTVTITSQLSMAALMWSLPCRPIVNNECESERGTAPLPMKVLTTGIPVLCASRSSCFAARLRTAPLPAKIIGFLAPAMASTA